MIVYLAGQRHEDDYRAEAIGLLAAPHVEIIDPISSRDFRGRETGRERDIIDGDLTDIIRCDVVLGNYSVPGWGTGMESWFARSIGRRVVAYVHPNARVSPWVTYISGGKVHRDLSEACSAATWGA